MKLLTGRVENGAIRLTEKPSWPEGTPVVVLVDVRPLTWKEAGEIVGRDEVGTWAGQLDSWEAQGLVDPVPENRCNPTEADLMIGPDRPTDEEAEDFLRALHALRAKDRDRRPLDEPRPSASAANGPLPRGGE